MWFPPWLYKLLPFAYLVFGLLMLLMFGDDALGRLGGILLCAAGILVLALRLYARKFMGSD
jgi:hypothetical protein